MNNHYTLGDTDRDTGVYSACLLVPSISSVVSPACGVSPDNYVCVQYNDPDTVSSGTLKFQTIKTFSHTNFPSLIRCYQGNHFNTSIE